MDKYRVNFTRTITYECDVLVTARGPNDAMEKAQALADDGKLEFDLKTLRPHGTGNKLDINVQDTREEIEIDDAYEAEDE